MKKKDPFISTIVIILSFEIGLTVDANQRTSSGDIAFQKTKIQLFLDKITALFPETNAINNKVYLLIGMLLITILISYIIKKFFIRRKVNEK